MSLGTRIKAARIAKNLTQMQLGAMVGVTGSAITNYEKSVSSPNENTLIRLMSALEVDANFLYADEMEAIRESHALSLDEEQLLTSYRALNEQGRQLLLATAESFAGNPAMRKDMSGKAI